MNQKTIFVIGAVVAGLGVAIGAFGAHGLKTLLEANERTETFELAVRYQFYHALAMLITALAMSHFTGSSFRYAALSFLIGILLFSGSLYILSLTGTTALGAVTPLGGLGFIIGWGFLIGGIIKHNPTKP